MLFEHGTVIAVEHDGLWLETLKQSTCKQCSAQKGCGQKLMVKSAASKMTCIKATLLKPRQESSHWQVGDVAEIAIDELALVNATFIAYGVPLLAMLLATVTANACDLNDVYVALFSVVGLFFGGTCVRWHSAANLDNSGYHAKVVRKIILSSRGE